MIQIQISLFSDSGYKPMSTIVTVGSAQEWRDHQKEIKKQAFFIKSEKYFKKVLTKDKNSDIIGAILPGRVRCLCHLVSLYNEHL